MNSKKKEKNQNIKVFVRVRPMNNFEKHQRTTNVVEISGSKEVKISERTSDKVTKTFTFDSVFGPSSKQIDVYNCVVGPLIDEVLSGYNCTVFAYGQTGTGKTFTMLGEKGNALSSWQTDPLAGVIPRAVGHLIDELRIQDVEYTIRVSFLELYNEELFDLLSPVDDNSKIRLFEDSTKKGSVIINGLEEVTVHSKNEVFNIMDRGTTKRQTAATLMNANSSRSHTVFSITVHMREKAVDSEELLKTGKLNLVDLAGSENIGRSGAVEKRAREAGNINQSLLTLGRVITALVEKAPHIPYRESKLTRLLQDSLGGRTKTSIIATISPASCNIEETLSTLEYANRAKNIQNRPEVNEKLSKAQLIKEYTEEIDRLRRDLLAARERNGVYIALENYNEMTRQLELNRQEINEKLQLVKVLEKEKADKEALCNQLRMSLEETEGELVDSKNTLKLAAETVQEQLDKEKQLMEQAQSILAVANTSTVDTHKLHDKLDRKRSVEQENSRISHDFRLEFHKKITEIQGDITNFLSGHITALNEIRKTLDESVQKKNEDLSILSDDLASLVNMLTTTLQTWSKKSSEKIGAAQQNTQNLLQDARSKTDTEINSVHSFLTERFLPITQNLQHQILRSKAENDGFARLVNEQAQRSSETVATFTRMQLEALSQLRHSFSIPIQIVQETTEQMQKDHKKRQEAKQKYNEELFSSLRKLIENARNIERRHQEFLTEENDESETDEDFKLIQQNTEKANLVVSSALETEERRCRDLHTSIEVHSEETSEMVKGFLERISTVKSGIEECNGELETVVRKAVSDTEGAWSKQYSFIEQQLRHISENIREAEKQHQDHTQLLTGSLHKSAHAQEVHIEEQRVAYASFIRDRVLSLEQQCAHISDWQYSIDGHVQERDKDVEQFIVELLRQDIPTGTTPQRRQFNYPTTLINSTPTKILEKLQKIHEAAQLKNKLDQVISEDVEAESTDSSISNQDAENILRTTISLHKARSNEDVNKENSRPGDKETNKLLKSASLNDMKVTPRKPLNAKN
ncbi:kinesin-like protein KIF11-A [Schistocerca serialis cubense]|uniref:kinesin-like protein KIF11-A n=1 Tax=Schistocerca serialis cubense TaxID=2023355 RepID=UPI00214E0411|nr:kinesin-like protein KIF11-A [Schistocerca serialis cubense]